MFDNNFAQIHSVQFISQSTLPAALSEISGIISLNQGINFLAINDSGNEPTLYELDSIGQIVRHIFVLNAKNYDWEAICADSDYVYIADTGNNKQKRKELQIYKISIQQIENQDSVIPNKITIQLPSLGKKISRKERKYDIEAIVSYNEKLFLFSKNWINVKRNKSIIYQLNKHDSLQTLHAFGTLKYSRKFFASCQITDASLLTDTLYLLSAKYIFQYQINTVPWKKIAVLEFPDLAQREGFVLFNPKEFITTNEKNKFLKQMQRLQKFKI